MDNRITHLQLESPGAHVRAAGMPLPERAHGVRATLRNLVEHGFQAAEAGNLTAFVHGLAPVKGGWTVDEIEHLLFVRHLVETRHIEFRPVRRAAP
jgi:hypothetical protein